MLSKLGNAPPHNPLMTGKGETDIAGVAMLPRNRVRTS